MARDDTHRAQQDVSALLRSHLRSNCRSFYNSFDFDGPAEVLPPLLQASFWVADDLVLMRRHDDGWRLVAASLFAPSYWTLAEKFDRPLQVIHDPVPEFGEGTRKSELITRMFDHIKPGVILERRNWSFHAEGDWYAPGQHPHELLTDDVNDDVLAAMFVRTEYQTIQKLPVSDDVLFTIGVKTRKLSELQKKNEAKHLADRICELDFNQREYKGLETGIDRLAAFLAG